MSGSAALASARRRRVNAVEQVSITPEKQPRQTPQTPQTNNDKILVSPLTIMKHHHNEILAIKEQINQLKNNDNTDSFNYEEGYNNLTKEVTEMKKIIVKLQSFVMDTDKEIKKLKEKKNVIIEEDDLSNND